MSICDSACHHDDQWWAVEVGANILTMKSFSAHCASVRSWVMACRWNGHELVAGETFRSPGGRTHELLKNWKDITLDDLHEMGVTCVGEQPDYFFPFKPPVT